MSSSSISPNDSGTISLLRLPLALGIIFIHLNLNVSGTDIRWASFSSIDAYRLVACVVTNETANLAVPLFFIISGFLFFSGHNDSSRFKTTACFFKARFARRLKSLLWPYMLFNLLAIIGLLSLHVSQGHTLASAINTYFGGTKWLHAFWDIHTTGTSTNILGVSKAIAYPINTPLWFVRDLMVLVILSPVIYFAVKRLRWWWVVVMMVFSFTGIWVPMPGFGVTSCLFFSIGACFSICHGNITSTLRPFTNWLLPLTLIVMVLDIITDHLGIDKYIHTLFLLLGTLSLFCLVSKWAVPSPHAKPMVHKLVVEWGGEASFLIYAVHTLTLPFLNKKPVELCLNFVWTNSTNGIVCIAQYIGSALLTFAMCYAVFALLKLVCPKALGFVLGR